MIYEPRIGKAKDVCSVVKIKRYLQCGFSSDISEYKIMCLSSFFLSAKFPFEKYASTQQNKNKF